jgi:hypothetical protein
MSKFEALQLQLYVLSFQPTIMFFDGHTSFRRARRVIASLLGSRLDHIDTLSTHQHTDINTYREMFADVRGSTFDSR